MNRSLYLLSYLTKKLSKFNDNDVKAYIEFLREIIEHFDLKYGDPRLVFSVYGGRLNLTVGHRYSWNLYRNNKEGSFGVISTEVIGENNSRFNGKAPLPFYNIVNTGEFTELEKESIFKAIENELIRVSKSRFRSKSQDDFERYVFMKNDINKKKYILSNITWNSNDWKKPSNDKSNHKWVQKDGNIPHESWNFDFDNSRNTDDEIYGYNQWTRPPTVTGSNNLIIFYSDGKIVGFYGKVKILKESITVSENEDYIGHGFKKYLLDSDVSLQDRGKTLVEKHKNATKFNLRPDIVVRNQKQSKWVLDTKWKMIDQDNSRKNYGISQADMYQLYVYGKKYEDKAHFHENMEQNIIPKLILLYPYSEKFARPLEQFEYNNMLHLKVLPVRLNCPLKDTIDELEKLIVQCCGFQK